MNVETFRERLLQLRNVGDVREHAQLDLRIVGRDELHPFVRDEGGANFATFFRADRNVLQIGIGRREPSRRRRTQRVARVNAAGLGVDIGRQRVGVRRLELRHLPPFEHRVDQAAGVAVQLLVGRKFIEQVGARFPLAALRLLAARQLQPIEQQFAELLRRSEIELVADEPIDLFFEPDRALREGARKP